mmetsp:Transcript_31345/g.35075  ORF Transcript_31345/g.35075 Transcript_31345/m.35075 type:complete len:502 (-) Transcript_31345:2704-4209(-)
MNRLRHCNIVSLCGCCYLLLTNTILAWKPLTIRRKSLVATTAGIATGAILSPAVLAVEEDYLVEGMMGFGNNNNIVEAGVATIAVVSSLILWRKLQKVHNELDALREEMEQLGTRKQELKKENPHNDCSDIDKTVASSLYDSNTDNPGKKTHQQKKQRQQQQEQQQQQDLVVKPIGVVRSIYRLCVGTPRQGLLAQDARGRIELAKLGNSSTRDSVSGLEGFSYIWVLFNFHLNTQSTRARIKSKISPPALGGKKVGVFCTRSPHRYNPIGITLCKLDRVEIKGPHEVILHVSGLDLVDGTPVIDIKPYVSTYDSVNSAFGLQLPPPRVPEWVEGGLATQRNVTITEIAKNELEEILHQNANALEFYGPHCGDCGDDTNAETTTNTRDTMLRVIRQVLAIDVRSSFQTRKARIGRSQAERSKPVRKKFEIVTTTKNDGTAAKEEKINVPRTCTQQLDNLLIHFSVKEVATKREQSNNSGAEDEIIVERIQLLPRSTSKKSV